MDVELSDADVADLVAQGHRDAEAEICHRMGPRIRLHGLRHLWSDAAADDLVQQVLSQMIKALRAGHLHGDRLAQYVLDASRTTVWDLRRRMGPQERLPQALSEIRVPRTPPVLPPDGDRLVRCLQSLTERQRTVVVLTFFDEETASATSESLNLSEADVRTIRHRALQHISACMGFEPMTPGRAGAPRECAGPLSPRVLMDYWLASLSPGDEEPIEEHLLACDPCGNQLRQTIALAEALQTISRAGVLTVVVSDSFVQRAIQTGLKVREHRLPRGGSLLSTVAADDDLVVARLTADLTGVKRVDLSLCDAEGVERQRLRDIPIPRDAGSVIYQESITLAKAAPSGTVVARLVAFDAAGAEQLLGDYTFHHTGTPPAAADPKPSSPEGE